MKPGKAKGSWSVDADVYVDECNWEREAGRSIEVESNAKPLSWGKCCESVAFENIGTEYTLCSNDTIQHPTIPHLVGTPDAYTETIVADLKCPMQLMSFRKMIAPAYDDKTGALIHEALTIEALRHNHKDGDKFFWQVVSNAILLRAVKGLNITKGQIIVFVPYEEQLDEIRQMAEGNPDYYWIWSSIPNKINEVPYLISGGKYKNTSIIEFDIFESDVQALTNRVIECGEKLIPWPEKKIV